MVMISVWACRGSRRCSRLRYRSPGPASDLQIDRYVSGLVEGRLIGAQANTEPHAGSDLKTIRTRAVRSGDEWVLNGSKVFITNAPIADVILVLAVTEPDAGRQGMGFFVIDAGTPGMTVAAPARKMGASASPTAEVFFDDCGCRRMRCSATRTPASTTSSSRSSERC
jgi:alkylation response protein AidB-like acyl-CoA dehydrogenase